MDTAKALSKKVVHRECAMIAFWRKQMFQAFTSFWRCFLFATNIVDPINSLVYFEARCFALNGEQAASICCGVVKIVRYMAGIMIRIDLRINTDLILTP